MRTAGKILLATAAVAALHSVLASTSAKNAAVLWVGERNRDRFYRPFFNAQSILSFGALLLYIGRLPDRPIWRVRGIGAGIFNGVRLAALWELFRGLRLLGFKRFAGATAVASGSDSMRPMEAQGPDFASEPAVAGPFRFSRHPLNFLGLPILWFTPRMNRNWFAFASLASIYLVMGSFHEERRLRARYGAAYDRYCDEVRFFIGRKSTKVLGRSVRSADLTGAGVG